MVGSGSKVVVGTINLEMLARKPLLVNHEAMQLSQGAGPELVSCKDSSRAQRASEPLTPLAGTAHDSGKLNLVISEKAQLLNVTQRSALRLRTALALDRGAKLLFLNSCCKSVG